MKRTVERYISLDENAFLKEESKNLITKFESHTAFHDKQNMILIRLREIFLGCFCIIFNKLTRSRYGK